MERPNLSLVTPTFNQASFLAETVDSVLAQEVPIEYLVIDDGSTDETSSVLQSFGSHVTWYSRSNRGQTATINEGWTASAGEIVGWLNSDDTLLPGAASYVLDFFAEHPDVAIMYGDTIFTDATGRPLKTSESGDFDYSHLLRRCENPIPQPSAFIRRRVLDTIGLLDDSLYYFMDWDYWLRAGVYHKIVHVQVPLSTYRNHPAAKGEVAIARSAPELQRVYEKFFETPGLPDQIHTVKEEALLHAGLTSAGYLLRAGAGGAARRQAFHAVRRYPGEVIRAEAVHKALYCVLGGTAPYSALRHIARMHQRRVPRYST